MRKVFAAVTGVGFLLACAPVMAQDLGDVKSKFASVSGIVQEKCMACHTKGYDLPFYAKVPGIRSIIEKDYNDGLRAMNLNQELVQSKDKPVGETVLAKMEWVINNDTMPPAKFAVVHWGSRLSDKEKKQILDWVATTRKARPCSTTSACPPTAASPAPAAMRWIRAARTTPVSPKASASSSAM